MLKQKTKNMVQIINSNNSLFLKIIGKIFSYVLPIMCLLISIGLFRAMTAIEHWPTRAVFFFVSILILFFGIYLFIKRKSLDWY